jgi:hypothetical protein
MPEVRTQIASLVLAAGLGLPAVAGAVPIDVDGPTSGWLAIGYPGPAPDPPQDQIGNGSNIEGDIVGDASNPAFYTAFDDAGTSALTDDMLGFRVRLGTDTATAGLNRVVSVGIDANLDEALDLFALVDNAGSNVLRLVNAGPGTNTSPATTSVSSTGLSYPETAASYNWSPLILAIDPSATTLDVDADGQTDHFVSFAVSFQDVVNRLALVGITGVDQNTQFRYVLGTSTSATGPLNQDLAGPSGSTLQPLVWDDLGAMSLSYAAGAGAAPVPEPGTGLSLGLGLLFLAVARRRRRAR